MSDPDDRGLGDFGMPDSKILEINGGYPFAARLDHILRAIRDLHGPVWIDRRDVAGIEEAILVENVAPLPLVIRLRDAGPADHEATESPSVPGQLAAGVIADFHLDR